MDTLPARTILLLIVLLPLIPASSPIMPQRCWCTCSQHFQLMNRRTNSTSPVDPCKAICCRSLELSGVQEWGPFGVRCNALAFGLIDTRLTQNKGASSIQVGAVRHYFCSCDTGALGFYCCCAALCGVIRMSRLSWLWLASHSLIPFLVNELLLPLLFLFSSSSSVFASFCPTLLGLLACFFCLMATCVYLTSPDVGFPSIQKCWDNASAYLLPSLCRRSMGRLFHLVYQMRTNIGSRCGTKLASSFCTGRWLKCWGCELVRCTASKF